MIRTQGIVGRVREHIYPDVREVAAVLRPEDARDLVNYCGAYIEDDDIFEKLLELSTLPEDSVRPFGCDQMMLIQQAIKLVDGALR